MKQYRPLKNLKVDKENISGNVQDSNRYWKQTFNESPKAWSSSLKGSKWIRNNSETPIEYQNVLNMFVKSTTPFTQSENVQKPKKTLMQTTSLTELPFIRNPTSEMLIEANIWINDSQYKFITANYWVLLIEKQSDTLFYEVDGTVVVFRTN